MKTLKEKLVELGACRDAVEWAGDKELPEAWETCPRGDWMLWLAQKAGVSLRTLTAAKAECAATVLHLMKDERSRNAVLVSRRYGMGEATELELVSARDAAYAAVYAAAYAAHAAAADTEAAEAAASAAYAAHAAYAAAAYAAEAYDAARQDALVKCADIVRGIITIEMLKL